MSRRLTRPLFPLPPTQYNQSYFAQLVQSFALFLEQVQNPGDARHTTMTITNLQSNDQGLAPGALFQQEGFVKIAQANTPHVAGLTATTSVGSVTVTTT
jgi:hypothetical protein